MFFIRKWGPARLGWGANTLIGGVYWAIFLRSIILWILQYCQNTRWLLNIIFLFGRCRRNWAAATPIKYEWDSQNLTYFYRIENFLYGQIDVRSLVTPTPGMYLVPWNIACSAQKMVNLLVIISSGDGLFPLKYLIVLHEILSHNAVAWQKTFRW